MNVNGEKKVRAESFERSRNIANSQIFHRRDVKMAGLTLPYLDWKYFRFENLDVPVCTVPLSKPLKIV